MGYRLASDLPSPFRLMLACCRWSYSGEGGTEVRDLARKVDAATLLATARRHRVVGLVHDALGRLGDPLAAAFAADARAIGEANLRVAVELKALTETFAAAALDMRIIKGLPLAARVYPRPFVKSAIDIDLLVGPADVPRAAGLLAAAGYRCVVPARMALLRWHRRHKESVWRRPADAMVVELHHALVDQPGLIPTIGVASPTVEAAILPGFCVPTFEDSDQFAYLSLHGASSLWFRAKWLSDIAALLYCSGDPERLYRAAIASGAGLAPALALQLCHKLFATELPPTLASATDTPRVRRLAAAALAIMTERREPTEFLFGTWPIHRAQVTLRPGFVAKAVEIKRQALGALASRLA